MPTVDTLLSGLRRSLAAHAKAYPQLNFREYLLRRLDTRLDKSVLKSLSEAQKTTLAVEMQQELEQLKRLNKLAAITTTPKDDYKTVLERTLTKK